MVVVVTVVTVVLVVVFVVTEVVVAVLQVPSAFGWWWWFNKKRYIFDKKLLIIPNQSSVFNILIDLIKSPPVVQSTHNYCREWQRVILRARSGSFETVILEARGSKVSFVIGGLRCAGVPLAICCAMRSKHNKCHYEHPWTLLIFSFFFTFLLTFFIKENCVDWSSTDCIRRVCSCARLLVQQFVGTLVYLWWIAGKGKDDKQL